MELNCFCDFQLHASGVVLPIATIKFDRKVNLVNGETLRIEFGTQVFSITVNNRIKEPKLDGVNVLIPPSTFEVAIQNIVKTFNDSTPIQLNQIADLLFIAPNKPVGIGATIVCNFGKGNQKPPAVTDFAMSQPKQKHGSTIQVRVARRIYTYRDGTSDKFPEGWSAGEYIPIRNYTPDNMLFQTDSLIEGWILDLEKEYRSEVELQVQTNTIENVEKVTIIPTNELDNSSFSIKQRVVDAETIIIEGAKIDDSKYIVDRWRIRCYDAGNETLKVTCKTDFNGEHFIELYISNGIGKYGFEQRVNVAIHNLHMFNYSEQYTMGVHVETVSDHFELKLLAYVVFGNKKKMQFHEIFSEVVQIHTNKKHLIYTDINFAKLDELPDIINKYKQEGMDIMYEGISFIPVNKSKGVVKLSNPFLVKGSWSTNKYTDMIFKQTDSNELLSCQRYYQRIIDICSSMNNKMENGEIVFIDSVNFTTTMVNVPKITITQKNDTSFTNDLSKAPTLSKNNAITLSPIKQTGDFALNPTTERFHIQGKANKNVKGNTIIIYSWEAECEE